MNQGKDKILMFQATDAPLGADSFVFGNLTEHSHSIENDIIDESTKFGRIVGYGQNSESFEFTAYAERGDLGHKAVMDAIRNKKQIKVWEVDVNPDETGTHDSLFAYGIVESIERSSGDSFEEISGTLQVMDQSVEGKFPALPPEVIAFARYGFEVPGESTGEYPEQTTAPIV